MNLRADFPLTPINNFRNKFVFIIVLGCRSETARSPFSSDICNVILISSRNSSQSSSRNCSMLLTDFLGLRIWRACKMLWWEVAAVGSDAYRSACRRSPLSWRYTETNLLSFPVRRQRERWSWECIEYLWQYCDKTVSQLNAFQNVVVTTVKCKTYGCHNGGYCQVIL